MTMISVIPASEHQDSAGILARSVADAAIMLSVIAGKDVRDRYTLNQPDCVPDYFSGLDATAIRGARLGVPRDLFEKDRYSQVTPEINACFNDALKMLESLGAVIVDHVEFPGIQDILRRETELRVLLTDVKVGYSPLMVN
jgi:amidase